jgi:hypothetical protein
MTEQEAKDYMGPERFRRVTKGGHLYRNDRYDVPTYLRRDVEMRLDEDRRIFPPSPDEAVEGIDRRLAAAERDMDATLRLLTQSGGVQRRLPGEVTKGYGGPAKSTDSLFNELAGHLLLSDIDELEAEFHAFARQVERVYGRARR